MQANATNSPDSSEESGDGSPNHYQNGIDGPNIEAEECLPSVVSYTVYSYKLPKIISCGSKIFFNMLNLNT